jgi:DNA mismatch repair protein MutS
VRVEERGHEIVFLHSIAPGRADRSYGIHVAKLAGVPEQVLGRAREILHRLEAGDRGPSAAGDPAPSASMPPNLEAALTRELSRLSVESMTPLDALNELARLRDRAQESSEH